MLWIPTAVFISKLEKMAFLLPSTDLKQSLPKRPTPSLAAPNKSKTFYISTAYTFHSGMALLRSCHMMSIFEDIYFNQTCYSWKMSLQHHVWLQASDSFTEFAMHMYTSIS